LKTLGEQTVEQYKRELYRYAIIWKGKGREIISCFLFKFYS